MPHMTINGAEIYYEDTGGGGTPLIFTHGVFFDARMCSGLVERLSGAFRCISFDWRGQGRSEITPFGHDVDALSDDALKLLDALEVDQPTWIGVSIGGVVGLRLAARYPERLQQLVLIGATAEKEDLEKLAVYEKLIAAHRRSRTEGAKALMGVLFGRNFLEDPARKQDREAASAQIHETDPDTIERAVTPIIRRTDIRHLLPRVRCPALIIVGEEDAANGPDRAAGMAQGLAQSETHILPNVGHSPPIEAPERVAELVAAFAAKGRLRG